MVPEGVPQPDLYHEGSDANSYKALLARDDVPCLIMALPIVPQPDFIKQALDAGKHVLAEKPVAKDVATAQELIAYAQNTKGTLAIAENIRFYESFAFAHQHALSLGNVTHFTVRVFTHMKEESKWFQTEWRKTPEYQGGFLLDGGVHYAAATRLMLGGAESQISSVIAKSTLVKKHLIPIDTVTAIMTTKSGAIGTYSHSVGSNMSLFDFEFAYENGSISFGPAASGGGDIVKVKPVGGEEITKEFSELSRKNGVPNEVKAWAHSILNDEPNPLQSTEEALADLEFMENIFKSGETGSSVEFKLQQL